MTVRGMLAEMTSEDVAEQMAYDQLLAEERAAAGQPGLDRIPTPAEVTSKLLAWRQNRAGRRRGAPPGA